PDGNNIVFGDLGFVDYVSADHDPRDIDTISSGDLVPLGGGVTGTNDTASTKNSVDINTGGNDAITTGAGNDVILGGPGSDTINSGDGQGIVFGDSGYLTSIRTTTNGSYATGTPFAVHPFQLGFLSSIQSSTDGADTIADGSGSDIVIGGAGNDTI